MEFNLFYRLACALAIGLIIGLQRESTYQTEDFHPAGIRTFAVTGILGALAALMSLQMGSVAPFVGLLVVIGIVLAATHVSSPNASSGITTSVSLVAVFMLGGLCVYGKVLESVAVAVCVLGLLALKAPLHAFAHKVSKEDILATLKFALISAVILPILPERSYGPSGLEVLSPYKVWVFVCFISGISFIGYVLVKWIGPGKGIGLTGLFGGLASSTALTLSLSQRSRENPEYSSSLSKGIVIAWSVMYLRLFLICAALVPSIAQYIAIPLLVPPVPGFLFAYYLHRRDKRLHPVQMTNFTNPFKLLPSIKFGVVFAAVLFVANAAERYFGSEALFASCFITGLADMDAITLSVLDMVKLGTVTLLPAGKAIAIASFSNTLCKGGLAYFLGDREMRRLIIPATGIISLPSLAIILFVL